MIEGSPPLAMQAKMVGRLGERPGLAHERGNAATDCEIDSLNECGLDVGAEPMVRKQLIEEVARTPEHACNGRIEAVPSLALDELAVEQIVVDMPVVGAGAFRTKPETEVCGDGVEVAAQPVAGEGRDAIIIQP